MNTSKNISLWMNFLKGFAILEIVIFHYFGDNAFRILQKFDLSVVSIESVKSSLEFLLINISRIGSQGIHIFFIMSGFGIALSDGNHKLPVTQFLARRLARIYPALIMAIIFVVFIQIYFELKIWNVVYFIQTLAATLLIQNYSTNWISAINGNWWFVGALIQMYLAHALLREKIYRTPFRLLIIVYTISLAYKILLSSLVLTGWLNIDAGKLNPYTAFFLNYWWEFVAGVVLAHTKIWELTNTISMKNKCQLLLIGIAFELVGIFFGFNNIGRFFNDDFFAIAQLLILTSMYLILMSFKNTFDGIIKLIAFIGTSSYGLYLIHHPVSKVLVHLNLRPDSSTSLIFYFMAYLLFCIFFGIMIERAASLVLNTKVLKAE